MTTTTQHYTNVDDIPLILAVMLATDDYDYNPDPNTISATTLLKPTRQLVLSARVPKLSKVIDVNTQISNGIGSAIHNHVEHSWVTNYKQALASLRIPLRIIDRIVINPTPDYLQKNLNAIPFYLEQRAYRKITVNGIEFTISGRYDFVANGMVQDIKSTSTFTYSADTKSVDHRKQGSIYRWLDSVKITEDVMKIIFVFLDWKGFKVGVEKNYPPKKVMGVDYKLMPLQETEAFIHGKLTELLTYQAAAESDLPRCTPDELWMSAPIWKYYKDPTKTKRATKNFDNPQDAYALQSKNACGIVREVRGEAKACHYCDAFPLCSQKDELIASGDLKL